MKKSEAASGKTERSVLTTAAEAIGSTLGKLAVKTGFAHPSAVPAAAKPSGTPVEKKPIGAQKKTVAKKRAVAAKAPAAKKAARPAVKKAIATKKTKSKIATKQ